ncbi:MAG TPA: response regulator [Spirochaetia bacterium]|nr:response regulator [Spirochaetia bacterium]
MTSPAADIVLVEDNAHDAELALYALSRRSSLEKVEVLRDGAEALEYFFCAGRFSYRRPDDLPRLVLLDLKLPKVDGIEVLRRLKSDPLVRITPIVMLTSSREERDISESFRLGANSYVVKPVDFDLFARTLREIGSYWLELNERAAPPASATPGEGQP